MMSVVIGSWIQGAEDAPVFSGEHLGATAAALARRAERGSGRDVGSGGELGGTWHEHLLEDGAENIEVAAEPEGERDEASRRLRLHRRGSSRHLGGDVDT